LGWPKEQGDKGILARLRLCSTEYSPMPFSFMVSFSSLGLEEEASMVWSYCGVGEM